MRRIRPRPAAMLVVLLLSGFGLWQCGMGMTTSPVVPMSHQHSEHQHNEHQRSGNIAAGHEPERETEPDSPMPAGLAALCLTVVVCMVAAYPLLGFPTRVLALVRRFGRLLVSPIEVAARPLRLAQLGVCRT